MGTLKKQFIPAQKDTQYVRHLRMAAEIAAQWEEDEKIVSESISYASVDALEFAVALFDLCPKNTWEISGSREGYPLSGAEFIETEIGPSLKVVLPMDVLIKTKDIMLCLIGERDRKWCNIYGTIYGTEENIRKFNEGIQERIKKADLFRHKTIHISDLWIQDKAVLEKEDVFYPDHVWKIINETVFEFFGAKEEYEKRNLEHARGIIAYGPPGTGKTTLAKFVESQQKDLTTIWVDFSQRDDLENAVKLARRYSPSMVVMEDLDIGGLSRREVAGNTSLWTLLNTIDGRNNNDGILFLATTNNIEDVDDALLRPGRFDVCINVASPDHPTAIKFITKLLLNHNLDPKDVYGFCEGKTCAEIEEIYKAALLRSLHRKEDLKIEHFQARESWEKPVRRAGFNTR